MRHVLVVVVALVGCKNVDDRIEDVEFRASDVDAAVCALADKDFDNARARVLLERKLVQGMDDAAPLPAGKQKSGAACVIDKMMAAKEALPTPVLALAHFKLQYAKVKPAFEALPVAEKKEATLAAFVELGTRADLWSRAAEAAAPLMIAELDKLGAAEDPRFFRGLVGANGLYGEKAPSAVKQRLSKLGDDPRIEIAWREQLVVVGDIHGGVRNLDFIVKALGEFKTRKVTLDKEPELLALLKVCALPWGRENCDPIAPALAAATKQNLRTTLDKHSSESWASGAREFVMKLDGGTAADVPKILAGIQASGSLDVGLRRFVTIPDPDDAAFTSAVDMLTSIGPTAVPPLVESFTPNQGFYQLRGAARALAKLDPVALAKLTTELLDMHDRHFDPRFPGASAGQLAAGLHALQITPGVDADTVFLRALSSHDPEVSGMATRVIKKRLERDTAIDALFRFMAAKGKYARREIDVYVELVTDFGVEATPAVVKNLEALLATAGSPAKVFWAHKVVGLMALKRIGTVAALDTVNKFSTDPGGYVDVETPLDANGKPNGKPRETNVPFKVLVNETVKAIALR